MSCRASCRRWPGWAVHAGCAPGGTRALWAGRGRSASLRGASDTSDALLSQPDVPAGTSSSRAPCANVPAAALPRGCPSWAAQWAAQARMPLRSTNRYENRGPSPVEPGNVTGAREPVAQTPFRAARRRWGLRCAAARGKESGDMGAQTDAANEERRHRELQNITVGSLEPHNASITLVAYDPDWPGLFSREADRLRSILGHAALDIEHVGSTSVPGLMAKPIIDILLVVPDSADERCYLPQLQGAGYVLRIREPEWFEHRLFKGPDTAINLHVFSAGAAEVQRMLLFRDRLRTDDAARNRYECVKRELAVRTWRHVQDYADAKTAVVDQILDDAAGAPAPSG